MLYWSMHHEQSDFNLRVVWARFSWIVWMIKWRYLEKRCKINWRAKVSESGYRKIMGKMKVIDSESSDKTDLQVDNNAEILEEIIK